MKYEYDRLGKDRSSMRDRETAVQETIIRAMEAGAKASNLTIRQSALDDEIAATLAYFEVRPLISSDEA